MTSKFEDKNYYEILGVSQDASKEAISKAYKEIALIYHPDSNFFSEILGNREEDSQSLEDFQIITNAFSVLTDDAKRAEYDSTLVSFRDWSDGETPDEYFNDMLKKKSISFGMRNLKREREATVSASANNLKYFQDFDKSRKSKIEEKSREYLNKIENSAFSQIVKTRFSNKLDLLMILAIGLIFATIILYFLAY